MLSLTVYTPATPILPLSLRDEEELMLAEAMEGYDDLETLLDHLLDLGDQEFSARYRVAPTPRAAA